jgi:hypothetical protein
MKLGQAINELKRAVGRRKPTFDEHIMSDPEFKKWRPGLEFQQWYKNKEKEIKAARPASKR